MPQKRVIYYLQIGDVAHSPQGPMGTIMGRGCLVPAVDCPNPQFGFRSPLTNCANCVHLKDETAHFIVCEYQQSQQERDQMDRMMKGQAPPPQAGHPTVMPPIPPGVHEPKKK